MTSIDIVHLSNKEFPDPHFYGNSIVAYLLSKYSPNYVTAHLTMKTNSGIDNNPNLKKTLEIAAKSLFNLNLIFLNKINVSLDNYINLHSSSMITVNHFIEDTRLLNMQRKTSSRLDILYLHCDSKLSGYLHNTGRGRSRFKQLRRLIKAKKVVGIAVSEYVKRSFKDKISFPIHVIKNGADPEIYSPNVPKIFIKRTRNELNLDEKLIWVGTAVRPTVIKGVDIMKSLIEKLGSEQYKNIGLIWAISNGESRREIIRWVEHNKVAQRLMEEGRLHLVLDISKYYTFGNVPTYDRYINNRFKQILEEEGTNRVIKIINVPIHTIIDIYIHPALREALSLSLIEALLSGKPIVSTDAGGIKEILPKDYVGLVQIPSKLSNIALKIYQTGNSYLNLQREDYLYYSSYIEALTNKLLEKVRRGVFDSNIKTTNNLLEKLSARTMVQKFLNIIEKYINDTTN